VESGSGVTAFSSKGESNTRLDDPKGADSMIFVLPGQVFKILNFLLLAFCHTIVKCFAEFLFHYCFCVCSVNQKSVKLRKDPVSCLMGNAFSRT